MFVGLVYATPSLYFLQIKWNIIGIRIYLMKSHKMPSKMINFQLFAIKENEENINNWNSPIDSYFLGGGHVLSAQKPVDITVEPKAHFVIQCLLGKNSPWSLNATKKLDKFIFSSTANSALWWVAIILGYFKR